LTATLPATAVPDCWRTIGVTGDRSCVELQTYTHCRNCPVYADAALHLLDRELTPDYRTEWTGYVAIPPQQNKRTVQSVFIFRIGKEWLSLSPTMIHSVAERTMIHRCPITSTYRRGPHEHSWRIRRVCLPWRTVGDRCRTDRQAENTSSNGNHGANHGRTTGRLGIGRGQPASAC